MGKIKTLNFILLVDAVALLAAVIVIGVSKYQDTYPDRPPAPICLRCSDLSLHPDDDNYTLAANFAKDEDGNGERLCCARNHEEITLLVNLRVDRKARRKAANQTIQGWQLNCHMKNVNSTSSPVLKVVGKATAQRDTSLRPATVQWDADSPLSVRRGHIEFDDGNRIVFKQYGYYFVYSQVTFRILQKDVDSNSFEFSFSQFIHRDRSSHLELLARSAQSHCVTSGSDCLITTTIGAVFHFLNGDKVVVKVHTPREIMPSAHSNYFGVFKVS